VVVEVHLVTTHGDDGANSLPFVAASEEATDQSGLTV
jgi:hypothetical protein